MPRITGQTGHIDAVLSGYAVRAFDNSEAGMIAAALLPGIKVDKQSGLYYKLEKDDFLRDEGVHALRAPRTAAKRVEYSISSEAYYCPNFALAHEFGLEEFKNLDAPLTGNQRVDLIQMKLRRAQEIRTANLLTSISNVGSGVALTGGNKWSDYAGSDPIADVNTGAAFIRNATGFVPNTLALDWDTWKILSRHPQFLDLYKYTAGGQVTVEQAKASFGVSQILVAQSIVNRGKEGQAASMTNIWGNMALLAYVPPSGTATFDSPAAPAVRFQWTDNGIYPGEFGVMRDVDDRAGGIHAETLEVGHFQTEKVVARDLAYLIKDTL